MVQMGQVARKWRPVLARPLQAADYTLSSQESKTMEDLEILLSEGLGLGRRPLERC